jgi:RimJ/RimL family protein N-acetyltransferase
MTDALRQFVQILFDGHPAVNLLKASVQEENQASVRVFLRNGFIHEETRPRKVPQGATPGNLLVLGLRRFDGRTN